MQYARIRALPSEEPAAEQLEGCRLAEFVSVTAIDL